MLADPIISRLKRFILSTHRFEKQERSPKVKAAFEDISQYGTERTLAELEGQVYITSPKVQMKIDAAQKVLDESCKFEGIGNLADEIYFAVRDLGGKEHIDELDISDKAKLLIKLIFEQIEIYEETSGSNFSDPELDDRAYKVHEGIIDLALKLDPETLTLAA